VIVSVLWSLKLLAIKAEVPRIVRDSVHDHRGLNSTQFQGSESISSHWEVLDFI